MQIFVVCVWFESVQVLWLEAWWQCQALFPLPVPTTCKCKCFRRVTLHRNAACFCAPQLQQPSCLLLQWDWRANHAAEWKPFPFVLEDLRSSERIRVTGDLLRDPFWGNLYVSLVVCLCAFMLSLAESSCSGNGSSLQHLVLPKLW